MREPKASWVQALRRLTGCETDDIRWNESVGRWEFILAGADGKPRSQFWGWFDQPVDPLTGLHPARELDDHGMREALRNLEKTFVGNPYDGAGTPKEEIMRRMKYNKAEGKRRYRQAGEDFADMAAERGHRLRGAAFTGWTRDIEIETPIGARRSA